MRTVTRAQLLELWRRAFAQIALQAAVDAQRVFDLAETMEPMRDWRTLDDGAERIHEALEAYLRRYPDGSDYLREALS